MNDAMLSVEVVAKMEALSKGLKQGTTDINDFVNKSMPGLQGLQTMLNSLGVNTSTQGIRGVTTALGQQRVETERGRAALIQQRIATEAQRTAMAGTRAELAASNAANGQARSSTRALAGSYDEARQKMNALGREIRAAGGTMNSTNPAIQAQITEYNQLNESLKRVDATMGNHQRNVGNYGGAISSAASALSGMVGGYLSAAALLSEAFSTALKTDAIKTSLEFTFNSVDVAKVKMSALRFTANRLGLEYISLADAYRSFAGAAVASNFPLKETDRIFNAVANAGAKMKLTTDQVSGALTALQQMISKGTVQAEELRGQLGERLPGAFAIAARAMGVTQQELGKLMKDGKVTAEDLLPKLATELDKTFSNDKTEVINSLGGSVARLKNHFTDLVETKGALSGFFTFVVDRAGGVVGAIAKMSEALGIFYDLATHPKTFIGDSARDSRSSSYDQLKASTSQRAGSEVKSEGSKDKVIERISKEIDLLKDLDASYKKINAEYIKTSAGDRSLTDTKKMQAAQTALQSQILFVRALKTEYDKLYTVKEKPAAPALDSIAKIRKEILLLSAMSGSSTKGSDVYNKIIALKEQLKDLMSTPKKASDKAFDTVESQVQAFQNRASIITKEGLAKDLQEWEDKYNKIKAVIAKLPAGTRKNEANATVDTNYKVGKANIVEANTAKVMEALKKGQSAIYLNQLAGDAKEIQAVHNKYAEILKLAEGNKDATAAVKKQEGDEITDLITQQGIRDNKITAKQIADVAKEYRDHKAAMFVLGKTDGMLAVEVAENEKAKSELNKQLSDNLVSYEDYQKQMAALINKGNALEIKPPVFDLKHFQENIKSATIAINESIKSFVDSGLPSAIGDSFSAIGTAMAEGNNVFAAAGQAMLSTISSFLGEMGKMLIKKGLATVAAGIALNIIVPGSGSKEVAGGLALMAAGAAMSIGGGVVGATGKGSSEKGSKEKATTYGVPQFAMGIQNFGGGMALVGERGPELVNLPTGSDVIPNHKMIPSINGGSNPTFVISNKISMGELVTAIKRQERGNNRT